MVYDDRGRVRASDDQCESDATVHFALMGDSFVEALQVPIDHPFYGRLVHAAKPGVCVENFGGSAYSPALYYLQYKNAIAATHPKHVLLLLYSNDVSEDTTNLALATRSADGLPVAVPARRPNRSAIG